LEEFLKIFVLANKSQNLPVGRIPHL